MKTLNTCTTFLLLALTIGSVACASKELYAAGQSWQRQECIKIPDLAQRERCMASAARSYEDDQREAAGARSGR